MHIKLKTKAVPIGLVGHKGEMYPIYLGKWYTPKDPHYNLLSLSIKPLRVDENGDIRYKYPDNITGVAILESVGFWSNLEPATPEKLKQIEEHENKYKDKGDPNVW